MAVSSDRRNFLKILGAAIAGGIVVLWDEIFRLIDKYWFLILAPIDSVLNVGGDEQQTEQQTIDNSTFDDLGPQSGERSPVGTETEIGTLAPLECTDVQVQEMTWVSTDEPTDLFTATLINQSDIAGTVVVVLRFYQTEEALEVLGEVSERVAVGGRDVREISIRAFPPSGATYAELNVAQQSCQ